jgi:hypothetical protein
MDGFIHSQAHYITMKSPLNPMKSPLNHHEITMKSPLNQLNPIHQLAALFVPVRQERSRTVTNRRMMAMQIFHRGISSINGNIPSGKRTVCY